MSKVRNEEKKKISKCKLDSVAKLETKKKGGKTVRIWSFFFYFV